MPRPRQLHDAYFHRAKAEGYAARSAYKLLQIQERFGVLRRGDRVLDLGCAPGSWTQVASEIVGLGQRAGVVGVDLLPLSIAPPPNTTAIIADAFALSPEALPGGGAPFDVVLSDMAPNTVGTGDDLRSVTLCRRVLELARGLLRPGGTVVMKVLEGSGYAELLRDTARLFAASKGHRPDATRQVSREIYIVAQGFRPAVRGAPARPGPAQQVSPAQQVGPDAPREPSAPRTPSAKGKPTGRRKPPESPA